MFRCCFITEKVTLIKRSHFTNRQQSHLHESVHSITKGQPANSMAKGQSANLIVNGQSTNSIAKGQSASQTKKKNHLIEVEKSLKFMVSPHSVGR